MTGMGSVAIKGFDYGAIDAEHSVSVRDAAARIKLRMARTASDIIEIGSDLIAVKDRLGHGHFLKWIDAEFGMHENTARNFMNVSKRFGGKSTTIVDFNPTALYELAAPSTPDDVVKEATDRASKGEKISSAAIKAMKRQWDDERKELSRKLNEQKEKTRDADATASDYRYQIEELRANLSSALDQKDTLEHELQAAASMKSASKETIIYPDETGFDELVASWMGASKNAKIKFLSEILK